MAEKPIALEHLRAELDKTTVISEQFKKTLIGLASSAVYEAYHRGVEEGKRRAVA